jgi:pimeloyl-ACP methyl ester carboxylesterase
MSEHRTVRANGLEFAYLEEGEGPLVILAHGFPDTAHTWDDVRPVLAAAGYRAVSPFMRGYHPTEVPAQEAFDSDTLGRDLLSLADALTDGDGGVVLVGHDWGASAAYSAAGLGPDAIRFLVTIAIPHPAGIVPTPKVAWAARHFLSLRRPGAAEMVRRDDFAHIDVLWRRWSPAWEDIPSEETRPVKDSLAHPGSLEAALGYYRALRPWLPRGHREKVRMPSVAIAGTDDIVPVSAYRRAASRYLAAYEVVSMPGGHFLHREHPERFNSELLAALKRYAPA